MMRSLTILILMLLLAPAAQAQYNEDLIVGYSAGHNAPAYSRVSHTFYKCHVVDGKETYCEKKKFTGSQAVFVDPAWGNVIAKGERGEGLPVPGNIVRTCKFVKGKLQTCSLYSHTGKFRVKGGYLRWEQCYSKNGETTKCDKKFYTGIVLAAYPKYLRPIFKEDIDH